jgi:hypothetical protein
MPFLYRRARAAIVGIGTAGILTAVGLAFSHDLTGFYHLPHELATGTTLHGRGQVDNVALTSVAKVYPDYEVPITALRIMLIVATIALTLRAYRSRTASTALKLALVGVYALILPVAGSISEIHYGILVLPGALWLITRPGWVARTSAALALLVLWVPFYNLHLAPIGGDGQLRWALGQTLGLVAALLAAGNALRVPTQGQ